MQNADRTGLCPYEGISLSLDNTFKVAAKASVIDENGKRLNLLKGGVLSVINESNEIIAWVSTYSILND